MENSPLDFFINIFVPYIYFDVVPILYINQKHFAAVS